MATSKKAVATSGIGLGKKVIFDDEGEAHQAYKILGRRSKSKHLLGRLSLSLDLAR